MMTTDAKTETNTVVFDEQLIMIACQGGHRHVKALAFGKYFAIHPDAVREDPTVSLEPCDATSERNWSITHIPTGHRVGIYRTISSLQEAIAIAESLYSSLNLDDPERFNITEINEIRGSEALAAISNFIVSLHDPDRETQQ